MKLKSWALRMFHISKMVFLLRENSGFVMDVIVQSKSSDAKRQCDQAIRQVEDIRRQLVYIG